MLIPSEMQTLRLVKTIKRAQISTWHVSMYAYQRFSSTRTMIKTIHSMLRLKSIRPTAVSCNRAFHLSNDLFYNLIITVAVELQMLIILASSTSLYAGSCSPTQTFFPLIST